MSLWNNEWRRLVSVMMLTLVKSINCVFSFQLMLWYITPNVHNRYPVLIQNFTFHIFMLVIINLTHFFCLVKIFDLVLYLDVRSVTIACFYIDYGDEMNIFAIWSVKCHASAAGIEYRYFSIKYQEETYQISLKNVHRYSVDSNQKWCILYTI